MPIKIEPYPSIRPGVPFVFAGFEPDAAGDDTGEFFSRELVVPALNLTSMERLKDQLAALDSAANPESLRTVLEATRQALARNYTGVPTWLIEQTIDLGNLTDIVAAFMGARSEPEAK